MLLKKSKISTLVSDSSNKSLLIIPRAEIAQFVSKFRSGHMVWPRLKPHRIMIDKIIFEFCVVVLILYNDYIDIKMPKAKSTWRVRKYFFINGYYDFKCRTLLCFIIFYIVYSIFQSEFFRKKMINNVIYF